MTRKSGPAVAARPTRVFVSYAHESAEHKEQVLRLSVFLRSNGIDTHLDVWAEDNRREWPAWGLAMIEKSDYVLVIASPSYRRIGDGYALPDDHRGVQAEAAALREKLHQDRAAWLPKILPVLLPGYTEADIPAFLQPASASRYPVRALTEDGARELLGILTGQPVHRAPPLGKVPTLSSYLPQTLTLSGEPASGGDLPLRDPAGGPWQGGTEVVVNGKGYLIHDPVPAEMLAADRSVVWREAVAERLAPSAGLVVLRRQVAELAGTRTAGRWRAAAEAEARLLADLEQVRGLPRLLDIEIEVAPGTVTVVTAQPRATTWRAVYGPDGMPLDPIRATRLLRAVRPLCSTLERLHERGRAHRALTPDAVLVTDRDGSMALRTLGLATMPPAAGEGPAEYRAPEQERPLVLQG